MQPEIAQLDALGQGMIQEPSSCLGDEHLAPVPSGCDPSCPVHIETHVVVTCERPLARVQSHPHPDRLFARPLVVMD